MFLLHRIELFWCTRIYKLYQQKEKERDNLCCLQWTGMTIGMHFAHVDKTAELKFPRLQDDADELS